VRESEKRGRFNIPDPDDAFKIAVSRIKNDAFTTTLENNKTPILSGHWTWESDI
jgi:hypothetical protein